MRKTGFFGLLLLFLSISPDLFAQDNGLFSEYEQIINRGDIPAIVNPTYVIAEKALIDDNTWILGVVIDGEAHAYSLNLLNHHEIVNDHFGDLPVAAVW